MWAVGQLGRERLAVHWVGSDLGSPITAASEFPGEIAASPGSSLHALQYSQAVISGVILIFTKLSDSKGQP